MVLAVYPADLPQYVEVQGFSGGLPDGFVETDFEQGPPRRDREGGGGEGEPITCVTWITRTQKGILVPFWRDTLQRGLLPFTWVHPFDRTAATLEFMKGGLKYTLRSGNLLRYTMLLRVLP
ncbi:MAG: hypothetical protein HQ494_08905 [Rhodospirillales bacterium]|nr:hypothetical protein [Rhodospirillales bacterium]